MTGNGPQRILMQVTGDENNPVGLTASTRGSITVTPPNQFCSWFMSARIKNVVAGLLETEKCVPNRATSDRGKLSEDCFDDVGIKDHRTYYRRHPSFVVQEWTFPF